MPNTFIKTTSERGFKNLGGKNCELLEKKRLLLKKGLQNKVVKHMKIISEKER